MTEREYNLHELLDELRSLPKDQAFFLLTAALRAEQVKESPRLTDAEIDMYPRSVLREIVRGSVSIDEGLENILAHYRDHYAAPQPSLPSDEIARELEGIMRGAEANYSHNDSKHKLQHYQYWVSKLVNQLRTKAQGGGG